MYYSDEIYSCPHCNISYDDGDILINNDWCCSKCGNRIQITISRPDGLTYSLIRKPVDQLCVNDYLLMPGGYEFYKVLAINPAFGKKNEDKICVNLKNFGHSMFFEDEYIECRI